MSKRALLMASSLFFTGTMHFVKSQPFDSLIPDQLPGTARTWVLASGAAELVVAGLIALPSTRKTGAALAVPLFLSVWPGNFKMAWDWRHKSAWKQAIAYGRLPLQIPMVTSALKVVAEESR